jgi:four helix bundle protein
VYRRAVELADDLRLAVAGWDSLDAWSAGIQLLRAADSVGANIAEAYGRHGYRDQRRFLYVARGSAYETEHWVDRAVIRGLLSSEVQPRIGEVIRTLNGLIQAHHRNA